MKMIRVLVNYGGGALRRRQRILPGLYAQNDPALCGQADYLVSNGHAVVEEVEEPASIEPVAEPPKTSTKPTARQMLDEVAAQQRKK